MVMLTTFELDEYVFEALRQGASGFLLKDAEPARLLDAIRVVADGGSLLAPSVTRRVIEHYAVPGRGGRSMLDPHPRIHELTDREREVVGWVATGRSNGEIAGLLHLSPETVRTHVSRAMIKLGARDRAQLVVYAIGSGLVAGSR
jgi:DNA-binding NarL/FixJ family response regulator